MDRQTSFGFPAADSPFTAAQKFGYFLPGIQAATGLRTAVDGLWMAVRFHLPEMAPRGRL
jgi:hypothetical protein